MNTRKLLKIVPAALVLVTGAVRAQNLFPLYGSSAGAVSDVAVATTAPPPGGRASDVAAAVVNGSGELELIAWQDTTSKLEHLGSASAAGSTSSVAITGLDSSRVVTASYSGNFTVAVNTWKLGGSDAGVVRQGSETQQPAFIGGSIGIARLSSTRVAVSFVDPSSANLFVYAYDISASGAPTYLAAWGVSGIADSGLGLLGITPVSSDLVMTAIRDLSGNLKVTTFKVTGSSVLPVDTYTAGPVSKVAIGAAFGTGSVMTACVDGGGDLEDIYWSVSAAGHITRDQTVTAGHVADTAAVWSQNGLRVTAVRGEPGGYLALERWQDPFLSSNGEIGEFDSTSPVTMVSLAAEGVGPVKDFEQENYFVTAARSTAGDLEVEVFKTEQGLTPPPP
jgi:hypothetical protein